MTTGAAPVDRFSGPRRRYFPFNNKGLIVTEAIDGACPMWWSTMQAALNSCAVQSKVSE
jgi:hypothetical protein